MKKINFVSMTNSYFGALLLIPGPLCVGATVYARNHGHGEKYVPGYVIDRAGPVSYTVEVVIDGRRLHWKRHIDQLHARFPPSNTPPYGNREIADNDDAIAESDISDVEDENANRDIAIQCLPKCLPKKQTL